MELVTEYRVLKEFVDKNTGQYHGKGTGYANKDTARIAELQAAGFLGIPLVPYLNDAVLRADEDAMMPRTGRARTRQGR